MSTTDLPTSAARFFLLAGQVFSMTWMSRRTFWRIYPQTIQNRAAHLPALSSTVRKNEADLFLSALALHPLPAMLSPEAVPWHQSLTTAWEWYRTSDSARPRNSARYALVRLDGCGMPTGMQRPSRLPEWLAEARRMVGAGSEPARTGESRMEKLQALAALAAWQPARGVVSSSETLRDWVVFWQQVRQSGSTLERGIAAMALLNLSEATFRAASIPAAPVRPLLDELAAAIPMAMESTVSRDYNCFPLLEWQPVEGTPLPAAGLEKIARVWLEISRQSYWRRQMAWRRLTHWDQTESLSACGIDLLPHLVSALKDENDDAVLWEMAHWVPNGGDSRLLRELERQWRQYRQFGDWLNMRAGWLGSLRLHQAGLASEPPAMFMEAYLSAVTQENDGDVLFVLTQWSPGTEAPTAFRREWEQVWRRRLEDENEGIRQVAGLAFLHQALKDGTGVVLRRGAMGVWRASGENRLLPDVSRLREVQAALTAGTVPDFERHPIMPAERKRPQLALPPGHIADRKWEIENEKLRIEN